MQPEQYMPGRYSPGQYLDNTRLNSIRLSFLNRPAISTVDCRLRCKPGGPWLTDRFEPPTNPPKLIRTARTTSAQSSALARICQGLSTSDRALGCPPPISCHTPQAPEPAPTQGHCIAFAAPIATPAPFKKTFHLLSGVNQGARADTCGGVHGSTIAPLDPARMQGLRGAYPFCQGRTKGYGKLPPPHLPRS